jgi:tripartite-type tricarboxylate transporter receptor subunit TctC
MKTTSLLLGWLLASTLAAAETAPLALIVGGPPGTPGDTVARIVGERMAVELGQPVVVENRPGAAGTVAMAAVARAKPDGNTLGIFALQSVVAPSMLPAVPYDVARDLAPIRQLSTVNNVLVAGAGSSLPTLEDLVRAARERAVTYGSGGAGTPAHLAAELFRSQAGVQMQHVPFNGPVAGLTAVAGGHVEVMFATLPAALPLIRAGKVRPLATTAEARLPTLPEVRTMGEAGWGTATVRDWHGLVAPAGTPRDRIERIATAAERALADSGVQQRLRSAGVEPAADSGPRAFAELLRVESSRWAALLPAQARAAGTPPAAAAVR